MSNSAAQQIAIQLDRISVDYVLPKDRVQSLKEFGILWLKRRVQYETFTALRGVSLEVPRGAALGIIGRNGSGKSTLLKVIAEVIKPTTGQVTVNGRISPLIELGSGFDFNLTGRENIFLNGAILGFSTRQMRERFDQIVDFAELHDFIEAPLRTYSSGMVTRLGFAIATEAWPEILILDEVLSVGDERFQAKCAARIDSFRDSGVTVLLVSHNAQTVKRICDTAIWLDHGQIQASGPVDETIAHYQHFLHGKPMTKPSTDETLLAGGRR